MGPRSTIPGSDPDSQPDLVERDFTAIAANQLWVASITYCRTLAGWVYTAFVVNVFSRCVFGWQLSKSLRTDLALDALEMAIWTRDHAGQDVTGLTHHSDTVVQGGSVSLRRGPRYPHARCDTTKSKVSSRRGGSTTATASTTTIS